MLSLLLADLIILSTYKYLCMLGKVLAKYNSPLLDHWVLKTIHLMILGLHPYHSSTVHLQTLIGLNIFPLVVLSKSFDLDS